MKIPKVGCYIRVSTENQLENYSIDEQQSRLKAYCTVKGWAIHKMYIDPGYSGGNINRPALTQMLSDIHNKNLDMVLVYKLDRLSRSQKDTLMLIEDKFLKNDVDFVSVSENFDTSTPFGKAMIGILSVFAQLEKDQITERFTMGRIGRCKNGYFHGGGNAPTGYDYINGKLEINPYTSEIVKFVFDRFLKGYSICAISKLVQIEFNTKKSPSILLNMLKNSIYIGKVKFKGIEQDGVHTPIIDKETFDKAQLLIKDPSRYGNDIGRKTPFKAKNLLTSLIWCNNCGARYSAAHGYYKCYSRSKASERAITDPDCKNKNWKIDDLNEIIISEIKGLLDDDDRIDNLFANKTTYETIDKDKIQDEISDLDKQISKVIDLYQFSNMPIKQITKRVDELQQKKYALLSKLTEETVDTDAQKQEFKDNLRKFNDVFATGTIEEKRLFVSTVIRKIFIIDERVRIEWRI